MFRGIILVYFILVCLHHSRSNILGNDHGQCKCEPISKQKLNAGTSFKYMHFSRNKLNKMTIPKHCNVSDLRKVEFSNNWMGNISRGAIFASLNKRMMAKITELILYKDCITNINRDTFQHFTALKKIDLRKNNISPASLVSAFGYLKNSTIETLRLDTNNLGNLSAGTFAPLLQIRFLYIKNNGIYSIANGTFAELQNLQQLDLTNNSLTELKLYDFRAMDKLLVSRNKLLAIPRFRNGNECISASLTVLQLSHNAIGSLGKFVGDSICLGKLKILNLAGNKIHTTDANVFHNLKLQNLNISNFPLANWSQQMIGDLLKSQTRLETLSMNECGIKELPESTFISLKNMKELYLANNQISSWTATTFGNDMYALDLQGNRIRLINQSTFPDTTKILYFSRNPFTCDCRLQWFRNWIRSNKVRLRGNVKDYRCESPENWKNKDLKNFNPTYVDCNPWNPYVIVAMLICITLVLLVLLATIIQNNKDKFRSLLNPKRQYERVTDSIDHTETI